MGKGKGKANQRQQAKNGPKSNSQPSQHNGCKEKPDKGHGKHHKGNKKKHNHYHDWDEDDRKLSQQLEHLGLRIHDVQGDGNCLFRSLMDQQERDHRSHLGARQSVIDYMRSHRPLFECFIDEDEQSFDDYLDTMAQSGEFGDHLCLVAYAQDSQHDIYVHQLGKPVWIIRARDGNVAKRQLHIVYHEWEHYDSVRLISNPDQDIFMGQDQLAVGRTKYKRNADNDTQDASSSRRPAADAASTMPRKGKGHKGKGRGKPSRYDKQLQRQARVKAKAKAAQQQTDSGQDTVDNLAALAI
eukprot:TRINITY_DN12472_c0_g3_i3.p3 TRINITY_DN12472_c0_g3~~TRINITY_DN12472_c0_g3_i3.p3  ORF type:complete len:298 (+),score=88.56 TRINITY_DN12472_c0_g3_i3:1906-2799(+)